MQPDTLVVQNKRLIAILLGVALLLLVPLVAMQFTAEVNWDIADFIFAGVLLGGTGLLYELAARKGGSTAYRAAAGTGLFGALALIWINVAVGLIGNENNTANLLYVGVIIIGFVGATVARLRARGMAVAMSVTAVAQALVPLIAFIIWRPEVNMGLAGVVVVNMIFVGFFAASAFLFSRAASVEKD